MRARSVTELFRDDPEPLVEAAALAIAADAYPALDVEAETARLDALGATLARRAARADDPRAQAAVLGTWVYDELGFGGNEDDYYDPRNSYLNDVVTRRRGIPITLAVVLMALGRRAGMALDGVSFPAHFLVRLGGRGGVYLDPFFGARVLDEPALREMARRALGPGGELRPEHLAPVGSRAIAARMLANLKAAHERRGDHARALVACDRLVDLTDAPEAVRDRGLHALALGARAAAREDLARYLTDRPDAADAETVREALRRAVGAAALVQ